MHKYRRKPVMTQQRNTLHDVYASVFYLDAPLQKKSNILTQLMTSEQSWRVIGISDEALKALETLGENERKVKVQRAHIVSRFSIASALFEAQAPLPKEPFETFFKCFDRTVLVAKGEHKHGSKDLPNVYALPPDDKDIIYFSGKGIGFCFGRAERDKLATLRAAHSQDPLQMHCPLDLLREFTPEALHPALASLADHSNAKRTRRKAGQVSLTP